MMGDPEFCKEVCEQLQGPCSQSGAVCSEDQVG